MKRFIGAIFILGLLFNTTTSFAQNKELKFGHVNFQEIMSMMPERDSAQQELQEYNQMLQREMQNMQNEYSQKLQKYTDNQDSYSDLVRKSKERELQEMQRRIQEFQSTGQQDFQQKQSEVLQPIMQKIENAVKRVGEKHGFIYIFDTSAGGVLYKSEQSENLLPMVKKELGIQ